MSTPDTDYETALGCFSQNLALIKPSESDPLLWNLSSGLEHLTRALQQDMKDLKKKIAALEKLVEDR